MERKPRGDRERLETPGESGRSLADPLALKTTRHIAGLASFIPGPDPGDLSAKLTGAGHMTGDGTHHEEPSISP